MRNIYLIGYRCTGKTHVGKELATKLERSFVDTDKEIVKQEGQSITDMVRENGWDYFREKENNILRQFSSQNKHIIATGGGIVLNDANIKIIKTTGIAIWLKASTDTIKRRMKQDQASKENRPSLTLKKQIQEIEDTLKQRIPLYEKTMDFSINTDHASVKNICENIINQLKR